MKFSELIEEIHMRAEHYRNILWNEGKVTFAAGCGKDALAKGANAGKIVRAVAQAAGGNGGGKPDSAMAGGKDVSKAKEAIEAAREIIANMIGE